MEPEINPYQSPLAEAAADSIFAMSKLRIGMRNGGDVLRQTVEQRARENWRLVTSFDLGSSDYLLWIRERPVAGARPQFRIVPLPNLIQCIRQRSFGPWHPIVADQMSLLEPGWKFTAYCNRVGYVLRKEGDSSATTATRKAWCLVQRSPVWWRTLFGFSWLPVLSEELNALSVEEGEVVGYVGQDSFLVRKHPVQPSDRAQRRTYRLEMWPNWKQTVLGGEPSIIPWFEEQASQDWELLSRYQGAIFLFAKTVPQTAAMGSTIPPTIIAAE